MFGNTCICSQPVGSPVMPGVPFLCGTCGKLAQARSGWNLPRWLIPALIVVLTLALFFFDWLAGVSPEALPGWLQ